MSKLAQFLKLTDTTQAEFAGRIGVHQSTVSRLCDGAVPVSLETALKIEAETRGAVRVSDWLPAEGAANA